ncbi:MAG TPA: fumarylacetoacetate hydrolase family protein [Hyphomicrobiaceae bacterium]
MQAQDPALPGDMYAFIEAGSDALTRARAAVERGGEGAAIPLSEVRLEAPFPRPIRNLICVGKNYYEHAHEFDSSGFNKSASGSAVPEEPIFFTKAPNSVIGPDAAIPAHNDPTGSTDYEGELTVVIGAGGRNIPAEKASDHIFGYTIINDVTARTLQQRHNQWFLGKSVDGFCPMGPAVVTRDEIPDITRSRLQTRVNGELRQDTTVSKLIFDIPTLIATLSRTMTLKPGELIATGTCAGVGIGFKPPKFLKPGDVVEILVDGVGVLSNPVA